MVGAGTNEVMRPVTQRELYDEIEKWMLKIHNLLELKRHALKTIHSKHT